MFPAGAAYCLIQVRLPLVAGLSLIAHIVHGFAFGLGTDVKPTLLLLPSITSPGIMPTMLGFALPLKSAFIVTFHEYEALALMETAEPVFGHPGPAYKGYASEIALVSFHSASQPVCVAVL